MFLVMEKVGDDGYFGRVESCVTTCRTEDAAKKAVLALVFERMLVCARILKESMTPVEGAKILDGIKDEFRVQPIQEYVRSICDEPPGVDAWTAIEENHVGCERWHTWAFVGYDNNGNEVRVPDGKYILNHMIGDPK